MTATLIGVDCATDPRRVGLARASFRDGATTVHEVRLGSASDPPAAVVGAWARAAPGAVLVALDAPLGWPAPLGDALSAHRAGAPLRPDAHALFRRETDRDVKRRLGKQSLDVGADRIARTAHAALRLLGDVGEGLGHAVQLVWGPTLDGVAAAEVYPAATLRACGIPTDGYKKKDRPDARERVFEALRAHVRLDVADDLIRASDDALDAVVCILAAHDVLTGAARPPTDLPLARREGWIWVRSPATP